MFSKIVSKDNIKFKEVEKKIFRFVSHLGCLILQSILEEQDEKIFKERDKEKYSSKGFERTSIQTIMGNVTYKRRRYEITEDRITKRVYLLDEQLKIGRIKKVSDNVVEKIIDIVKVNSYRDTEKILLDTTGVELSFEAIRNIILEVGEKIADREKRLVDLKKKEQLV